eukprot:353990-Chlamydomonas_euryale.AAC.2
MPMCLALRRPCVLACARTTCAVCAALCGPFCCLGGGALADAWVALEWCLGGSLGALVAVRAALGWRFGWRFGWRLGGPSLAARQEDMGVHPGGAATLTGCRPPGTSSQTLPEPPLRLRTGFGRRSYLPQPQHQYPASRVAGAGAYVDMSATSRAWHTPMPARVACCFCVHVVECGRIASPVSQKFSIDAKARPSLAALCFTSGKRAGHAICRAVQGLAAQSSPPIGISSPPTGISSPPN